MTPRERLEVAYRQLQGWEQAVALLRRNGVHGKVAAPFVAGMLSAFVFWRECVSAFWASDEL